MSFKIDETWYNDLKLFGIEKHFKFNDYILIGHIMGHVLEDNKKVGRVVQIRKEAGICGTDCVLIRHYDGSLSSHENQCFYKINKYHKKRMDELFKDSDTDIDHDGDEYTICDKLPATGFIVKGMKDESGRNLSFTIITTKVKE